MIFKNIKYGYYQYILNKDKEYQYILNTSTNTLPTIEYV